jgi:hypothetical protein
MRILLWVPRSPQTIGTRFPYDFKCHTEHGRAQPHSERCKYAHGKTDDIPYARTTSMHMQTMHSRLFTIPTASARPYPKKVVQYPLIRELARATPHQAGGSNDKEPAPTIRPCENLHQTTGTSCNLHNHHSTGRPSYQ